jgi:2-oxoglutarate-Fe(II)-dependent oxygenase superfamily protein
MNDLKYFSLHTQDLDDAESVNQQLIDGLNSYIDATSTRKSHHFFGRYENIYIDKDKIPALQHIIESVKNYAADILGCKAHTLKAGLWFNVMNPGDKTTLHRHDDDDELLSAVYYVQVAENSGKLYLKKKSLDIQVTPKAGMFVFFRPDMPHEVTENLSQVCRISLGINIGPA